MKGLDLFKTIAENKNKYIGYKFRCEELEYLVGRTLDGEVTIFNKLGKDIFKHTDLFGLNDFFNLELEEIDDSIPWQECIQKYMENPNKFYIEVASAMQTTTYKHKFYLSDNKGEAISFTEIKNGKWYLKERD